jgi:two-component system, cell cycle sensor histidine kinase and response regulator CckA
LLNLQSVRRAGVEESWLFMAQPCDDVSRDGPEFQRVCRSIVEHVPEVLALLDADGKILYVNPHTEKVLGYARDKVEGRNIFEFVHPADKQRALQEFSVTVQQQGEQVPSVLRIRDSAGEWIPFEVIASNRLRDPETEAVIFTARDLRFRKEIEAAILRANADTEAEVAKSTTELTRINAELRIENQARRQAESRLEHTISLLHATLDSTADGILVVSLDGKIISCNKKFAQMWRLECGPSIERDDQALLARVSDQLQNPKDFLDKVRTLYADPAATSFDVLFFRDGRIFERYSQPQLLDEEITGRVWSFRDVTRARNLEAELHQSQKMEALGKLAGGVAHDFNNLLMLITSCAAQIERTSNDQARSLAEQILTVAKRAASLTKQLLTFSRKQPESPVAVDLNLIVMNMELMLRRLLSEEIQLEVSLAADPQTVRVDISQIEIMILNLAVNAQDAMPDGGRLSIKTSGTSVLPEAGESNQRPESFVVLEVSDTGHGMTPEVRERIFEPFYTTKQVGRGTGLGLSTVLGIVKRAQGKVEVKSESHHGATFRVYLPRYETPAPIVTTPAVSVPDGGAETILLAEDESAIRSMTRAYLESLGYRVLEATDGDEAIKRSSEYAGTIDLVLTDLHMPNRRGDSALEIIRRDRPGIKAIFMSGYLDDKIALDAGKMLYKPFTLPELGRQIRSALDSNSGNAAQRIHPAAD